MSPLVQRGKEDSILLVFTPHSKGAFCETNIDEREITACAINKDTIKEGSIDLAEKENRVLAWNNNEREENVDNALNNSWQQQLSSPNFHDSLPSDRKEKSLQNYDSESSLTFGISSHLLSLNSEEKYLPEESQKSWSQEIKYLFINKI